MAQRSHTTDAGSIACVDLGELGAGKEGWLVENPNLISALDTHSLALANCSIVLLLEWSNNASDALSSWVRIRPNLSPIEAEYISAIEWLVFDDVRVLALGTSCGYLLIYSLNGQLIHKQDYLLRLRVAHHRWDPTTYENEKLSSDVLISTPIFTGDGEGGSGFAAAAAGGASGFDFDVDPNVDPELALALLVSTEEERARQEKAAKKAAEEASNQGKSGEQESTSQDVTMTGSAVPAASEPENKTADLMADLLLSFGHGNDLRALSAHIPRRCHCLLMSATISAEVEKLAAPLLHNPYILTLQEQGKDKDEIVSKNIQQYYIKCSARDKILYKIC